MAELSVPILSRFVPPCMSFPESPSQALPPVDSLWTRGMYPERAVSAASFPGARHATADDRTLLLGLRCLAGIQLHWLPVDCLDARQATKPGDQDRVAYAHPQYRRGRP